MKPTDEWKFATPVDDYNELFPMRINSDKGDFKYLGKNLDYVVTETESDMGAVLNGIIAITPCGTNTLDERVWDKIKRKV